MNGKYGATYKIYTVWILRSSPYKIFWWLVVLWFNATLTATVISWRSVTHISSVSWLSHTSTNTTPLSKPPTTFLTCFSRGQWRKYAGKRARLNRISNSRPLASNNRKETAFDEIMGKGGIAGNLHFSFSHVFYLSETDIVIWGTFTLPSANCINLFESHYNCGICRRQCHYEFNTVFWKSCVVICAKPRKVDPITLISLRQISLWIALKYIINNSVWKLTESGYR